MTMVTRWNPFHEFDNFVRAGLVPADPGTQAAVQAASHAVWQPAVDIIETDADFRLLLEIPAVAAEDVKVAVEDNVLTISGERRMDGLAVDPAADVEADVEVRGNELVDTDNTANIANPNAATGVKHHRRELRFGRFSRSFRLPETVDEETINAKAKDGVLTLTIAKRAQPQPRQIEVKVH